MQHVWLTLLTTVVLLLKNGQCQFGMGMGSMMWGQGSNRPAFGALDGAIKQIIGPNASPNNAMINIAMRQRDIPRSLPQIMEYMPHFQLMARQLDVKPPGVTGRPTEQQLSNFLWQRANRWMQTNAGVSVVPNQFMASNVVTDQVQPGSSNTTGNQTSSTNSPTARNTPTASMNMGVNGMAGMETGIGMNGMTGMGMNGMTGMGMNGMGGMGMNGMGGMGGLMGLMALGGFEGLPFEGLGIF